MFKTVEFYLISVIIIGKVDAVNISIANGVISIRAEYILGNP